MIAIHFEESTDCKQILSQLREYIERYESYGFSGEISSKKDQVILLNDKNNHVGRFDSFYPLLISVLTDYIINEKEDGWLLKIIESMFYFTVEEEKQQILMIARTILEGDRGDIPFAKTFINRREMIYEKFSKQLYEETTIYFEAFLTFRLREYNELLIDCVEMAIDEYKMEQEHQNVIENLRHYLRSYEPKQACVHLVHDEGYTFYNEFFQKITKDQLIGNLEWKLVFERGIAFDEMVLSPLVSLAPRTVYVYSDDPDDTVILSIQIIFQERMKLLPLKDIDQSISND